MLPACRDLYGLFLSPSPVESSRAGCANTYKQMHQLILKVRVCMVLGMCGWVLCRSVLVFSLIRQYLLQHPHRSPHTRINHIASPDSITLKNSSHRLLATAPPDWTPLSLVPHAFHLHRIMHLDPKNPQSQPRLSGPRQPQHASCLD